MRSVGYLLLSRVGAQVQRALVGYSYLICPDKVGITSISPELQIPVVGLCR